MGDTGATITTRWRDSETRPKVVRNGFTPQPQDCLKRFFLGGLLGGYRIKSDTFQNKIKGQWWSRGGSNP